MRPRRESRRLRAHRRGRHLVRDANGGSGGTARGCRVNDNVIGLILAVLLIGYLIYALVFPERL